MQKIGICNFKAYGKIEVDVTVYKHVSFIVGNSGSGKTCLYKYVEQYVRQQNLSNFLFFNYSTGFDLEELQQVSNNVIFIDNADILLDLAARSYIKGDKKNYYIVFGRDPLYLGAGTGGVGRIQREKNSLKLKFLFVD